MFQVEQYIQLPNQGGIDMLYVKHVTKSGKEKFFPVLDNNVYVFCDRCEQMVLIPDPAGYIYELGACSDSIPLIVKVVVSKKLKSFVALGSSCLSGSTMNRMSCK